MTLKQVAQQPELNATSMEEALVMGGGANNWIIQSASGTYKASKAFSCLVHPEIGDKVLSVLLPSGGASILAILEREQSQTTRLQFDSDVDISSSRSIRMVAGQRLDALSGVEISLDSKQFSLRSKVSSVIFDRLSVTGNEACHTIGKIRVIAKYLETVSETSKQVMMHSFRLVSGRDSVSAGEVFQNIKNRFTIQSRQVSLLAKDDAKLNGKRVHLG